MDVYYCDKCAGRPYTKKLKSGPDCPQCGGMLRFEDVSEESLAGRPELQWSGKHTDIMNLIRHQDRKETVRQTQFSLADGEIFYEYLCFEKTGAADFTVRFILGNQPDGNSVITKTPFVSPGIKFMQSIELSQLELMRKSFERYFLKHSFRKDVRLFHAFVKTGDEVIAKSISGVYDDEKITEDERYSERYFISYDIQKFGEINLRSPFNEVKRVLDSRNEKFMEYMIFRARNGDNMTLSSFADDSAVIFDEPHLSLIRYDRLLKEAKATRM